VAAVVAPAVATLFGAGDETRIARGYGRALRLLSVGTLPLAVVAVAVGPAAVTVLYGQSFDDAGPVLLVMLATLPVVPLLKTSNGLLHGLGRVRVIVTVTAAAAAANVALDFLLIPRLDAVGAALANGCAQLAVTIPILVYAARAVGGVSWQLGPLVRLCAASAVAGLAALGSVSLVADAAGVAAGLAAGLAAFLVAARLLRAVPEADAVWLADKAGGRAGRLVRALVPVTASGAPLGADETRPAAR
jgi:O-antigen/teichoic acid export membrane protein